ncbi:Hsp70 family protein [Rothia mucilaginosa]|uniref:Hsp70 family protein n=1 Tax=Rothia mucilaginosa TaxID=43675 RepID=UPI003C70D80F
MGIAIGIDLGTTNSAAAVVDPTGVPRIVRNRDGANTTPSVVLLQDYGAGDEPLIGVQAKQHASRVGSDVAQHVKRYMGESSWRFDSATGSSYTSEEISAMILRRLKEDVEMQMNVPVTDAVITVPAYFDDARRLATRHAGEIAGLNVLGVLNEPTAAALAYGVSTRGNTHETVLVYDLGGGTFDVTILNVSGGDFTVLATDGDRRLGGYDFDSELQLMIDERVRSQGGPSCLDDLNTLNVVREQAEQVKKTLSSAPTATVQIAAGNASYRVTIERAEFERRIERLLRRTRDLVIDTLESARLGWSDISRVLLVGGSTRVPAVRAMLKTLSGKEPDTSINPDEAVALGAAVQAALLAPESQETVGYLGGRSAVEGYIGAPVRVQDVTSQGLGVLVLDEDDKEEFNSIIIPRNTPLPASETTTVKTVCDYQSEVEIRVTQGDDKDPDFVTLVGEATLRMPPYPKGAPLSITYSYDRDQIIQAEVKDLTSGILLGTFSIERVSNLKEAQVEESKKRIGGMTIM